MNEQQRYDVFLSHNSLDKEEVKVVAKYLETQGLKLWLDVEQIDAGGSLPQAIKEAIFYSKSSAFFIGKHGLGRWQKEELEILEAQRIEQGSEIFPILLPGVSGFPNKPELLSLKRQRWISLKTVDDTKALDDLTKGIKSYIHQWATKELEKLQFEKEEAEEKLQDIKRRIDQLEEQLRAPTRERQEALDWLSSIRRNAKTYGRKALKSFPNLERAVKEKSASHEARFYSELENCMLFVYFTFSDKSYRHLDEMSIRLTLSDPSIYGESANLAVYISAIDLVTEQIPDGSRKLSKEVREELNCYFLELKKRLQLLSD